jgi:predicted dehydrogenase
MRFGLFGTGFWAAEVHAAGLTAVPDAELVGVWGRDASKTAALAERYGITAYADQDDLIADVDAIDVALPPDVQAPIAARAAAAGKHLLLDKPLALAPAAAADVVAAVRASGVASVVFFTSRFLPATASWLETQGGREWHGAEATWLGSIFHPGNPFGGSPWRRDLGGLWDVGPHSLSMTIPLLGRVARVASASRDRDGTVRFVVEHDSGAVSVQTVGIDVPEAASANRLAVYGEPGWSAMPERDSDEVEALRTAAQQLLATAATGTRHPCDVEFAAHIVDVLTQAQTLLDG